MSLTLVDSNIILDIVTENPQWYAWSSGSLAKFGDDGGVAINPLIYAESSAKYESIEDFEFAISLMNFQRLSLPWEAAFIAAKCHLKYKKSGGAKTSPLPDFYIGAHAAVSGLQLLTRDAKRYKNYFPKLKIIAP